MKPLLLPYRSIRCFFRCALLLGLLYMGNSCIPTKRLGEDEYLLLEQKVKGNKVLKSEELEALYRQKPNSKVLYLPVMPYLSAYFLGEKMYENGFSKDSLKMAGKIQKYRAEAQRYTSELDSLRELPKSQKPSSIKRDTSRLLRKQEKFSDKQEKWESKLETLEEEGNWLMSSVGEPPVLYDAEQKDITLEQINLFLDANGFFEGKATATVDTSNKKISVTYQIEEGPPHIIDTVQYYIPDSAVAAIVIESKEKSNIQEGQRFKEDQFEAERIRLLRLLKNRGYYDFAKSYVSFEVDTLGKEGKASVATVIRNPIDRKRHKAYAVSSVLFDSEANALEQKADPDTIRHRGITYVQGRKKYSKRVMDRKVFIRPGEPYRQEDAEETQRSLAALNIFKFVNLKYDTTGGDFKANIFTSPYPKFQVTAEGGLNVGQAFIPGPFMSFSFLNRNMLNSADIFEVRAQFSAESQASVTENSNRLQSLQASTDASVSLPRVVFPIPRKWKRLLAARLPKTRLSLGYSYTNRPEYVRTNLQSELAYEWVNRKDHTFQFSLLDLGLVNTASIDTAFQRRLEELQNQGNTLINSFDRSIVSSSHLGYTLTKGKYGERKKPSGYLRLFLEVGGVMPQVISNITRAPEQRIFGLRFYEFYKASIDKRWSIPVNGNGQLAARVHAGIANSFGGSEEALPYEKYFFTGGSSSNRAWRARRIGPGSYTPPVNDDGTFDDRFEQYGEILVEANIELRGTLISFIDGALFVDASNIWMTQPDSNRPGAVFEPKDFWKEFAIGAGFGLRFDFSFLLIRFDMGIKMYDPAQPEGNRFVGDRVNFKNPLGGNGQQILNVGIGYPF